jgi:hypothetical protein
MSIRQSDHPSLAIPDPDSQRRGTPYPHPPATRRARCIAPLAAIFSGRFVNRQEAVVALLEAMDDWVPTPPTSTGRLASVRGEVAIERIVCRRCQGRRTVGASRQLGRGVRLWRACPACAGEGCELVDPMTAGASREPEREGRRAAERRRERELRRLEIEAAHREGRIAPDETEGWERSREWLERHGSFRELRGVLASLRAGWPEGYAALLAVHGPDRELRSIGPGLRRLANLAEGWVAESMPAVIRVPARSEAVAKTATWRGRTGAHQTLRASRDERLRDLAAELGPTAAAQRFGLSVRHVRRLLKQPAAPDSGLRGVSGAGL